jgi:hypothetical protein
MIHNGVTKMKIILFKTNNITLFVLNIYICISFYNTFEMKYYNLNGTLVVMLTTGLEVQFALETMQINGWTYQKLYAAFTFDSPYFENNLSTNLT